MIKNSCITLLLALILIVILSGCSNNTDKDIDNDVSSTEEVDIVDEVLPDEVGDAGDSFELDNLPDTDISETSEEKQR